MNIDLMRWETEGGKVIVKRPAELPKTWIMRTNEDVPVVFVPQPPRDSGNAGQFARGVRAYADAVHASGIIVITPQEGDSHGVIVELGGDLPGSAFALAERAGELLQRAGLPAEFGRLRRNENDAWTAIQNAYAAATFPLVRVSVPMRYGRDLTVLATAALLPLGVEGVLLVGLSDAVREGVHRAKLARELREAMVEEEVCA